MASARVGGRLSNTAGKPGMDRETVYLYIPEVKNFDRINFQNRRMRWVGRRGGNVRNRPFRGGCDFTDGGKE